MEEYGRGGRGHETRSNLPSSSINQFPLSRIRRKRLHLSSTLLGPQFAFSTSESEKAANSQGERAAAFPYSHSRGVGPRKHYFVIIARKAICASLPACLRSFVVTGCCCMHRHAPIRNNKITVRESASGLKRLLPAKSEMVPSPPPPARLTYETNLFTLSHGIYLTICV